MLGILPFIGVFYHHQFKQTADRTVFLKFQVNKLVGKGIVLGIEKKMEQLCV